MTWVTLLGLDSGPLRASFSLLLRDLSSACYSLFWNAFFSPPFFDWKVLVFFKAWLKVTLLGTPSITWLWQITVFSSVDIELPILCPHNLSHLISESF